jgi:hypothetical protein
LDIVPRYFFNVRAGEFEETDMVGRVCASDVGALNAALGVAGAVIQRQLRGECFCLSGNVEVEDERHRVVLTLPLRAASY